MWKDVLWETLIVSGFTVGGVELPESLGIYDVLFFFLTK